ncbi:hypothetical protein [Anoxybacteroides tepidamans]|uniref:hypothetical protein n=1 Tax=Anoxybacteroides tepidamans TaxID=265948 RepID=UPI0005577FBE|nr:hypothetical protein [Anoxybacillus tepidamans]
MQNEEMNNIKIQIQKVMDLVNQKKNKREHKFLDTLLDRLQKLLETVNDIDDINDLRKYSNLRGALRAYFDTNLIESYDEPLVIELDKLEIMLQQRTN